MDPVCAKPKATCVTISSKDKQPVGIELLSREILIIMAAALGL